MWLFLIQGVAFGLAAAAQPGPFQAYLLSQTLRNGWRATLPAALAPLISDGPIILITFLLLSRMPAWLQRGLYLVRHLRKPDRSLRPVRFLVFRNLTGL